MLSALQQRVALILADLPEAEGFALAGGRALIVRGAVERETHDLDFFVGEADAVDRLLPAIESALRAEQLAVERRQVAHGFARLSVREHDDHTEIDLCVDHRLLPAEPSAIGPVLSLEELAAVIAVCTTHPMARATCGRLVSSRLASCDGDTRRTAGL